LANSITGINEVKKLFEQVGKAPAKVLTKAAKSAGKVVQMAAKAHAPVGETGALRKGIKLKAEKAKKGKRVYQIFIDNNPYFVKLSKNPNISKKTGKLLRSAKRSFYPASQEYGWTDEHGNYTPGYQYMHKAADENGARAKAMMLEVMAKELDKLR